MCDKAVDACLPALKFVPDLLVTSKMFQILDDVVFSNDAIDLDYTDPDTVTFFSDNMGINIKDLNNIKLGDNDGELEIIIHVRLVAWCN